MRLRQREHEQQVLADAARDVARGLGRLVVIPAAAGLGKSALLDWAADEAAGIGASILRARGGPLQRDLPFGVAREALSPAIAALDPAERDVVLADAAALARVPLGLPGADATSADPHEALGAALHGLFWLCSNLAERAPLLVMIDDAHWADDGSLRWLSYMARRVRDVPLGLFVAGREEPPLAQLVAEAAGSADGRVLALEPLSAGACGAMVHERVPAAAPAVAAACAEASGGNPFLLWAILDEVVAHGLAERRDAAETVRRLTPARVVATVAGRLSDLPPRARSVASAVAVLGNEVPVRLAAAVAGIPLEEAWRAADDLAGAALLHNRSPLEFRHPLLRAAVEDAMPPGARAEAQLRAARVLQDQGAPPERVAAHLLEVEPAGETWIARVLEAAGAAALQDASPAVAARYLRRALDEPAPAADRPRALAALAFAELLADDPRALGDLTRAVREDPVPARAAQTLLDLFDATLRVAGDFEPLRALATEVRRRLDGADRSLAFRLDLRTGHGEVLRALVEETDPAALEPLARMELVALRAARRAHRPDGTAAEAVALAREVVADVTLLERASRTAVWFLAVEVLHNCDRFDLVGPAVERALAEAHRRGSEPLFQMASVIQAWDALSRADLRAAEAAAGAVWDRRASSDATLSLTVVFARSTLVSTALARGEVDRARALLAEEVGKAPGGELGRVQDALSWAGVSLAEHDWAAAASALEEVRGLLAAQDLNPVGWEWSLQLVRALIALDRREEAAALAEEELDRWRRFGAPSSLARALRAVALVRPAGEGIAALHEAVEVVRPTPARLLLAEALTDLGALQRRAGQQSASRTALREAVTLADEHGAGAVLARAWEELRASGGRRRRRPPGGLDALTPSEWRIARLAARGLSNKEIAQSQFLSLKTVEMHLGRVYRKLDIGRRADLAEALPDAHAPSGSG